MDLDHGPDVKVVEKISLQGESVQERRAAFENGDTPNPSHQDPPSKLRSQSDPIVPTFSRATKPDKPISSETKKEVDPSQEDDKMDGNGGDPPDSKELGRNPNTSSIPDPPQNEATPATNENPSASGMEAPSTPTKVKGHSSEMDDPDSNKETNVTELPQPERDLVVYHRPREGSTQHDPCTRNPSDVPEDHNLTSEQLTGGPGPTRASSYDPHKWQNSPTIPVTYHAPKYTTISKDLANLLATSGGNFKAIFFHWVVSSESTKREKVPNKFYPEKWKIIDENLHSLWEACETRSHYKDNPWMIGRRFKEAVTPYRRDALDSDFGILSGEHISPNVVAILPKIVTQALRLPNLLSSFPIPVLKSGKSGTRFVTKSLCCSLLANAFFSTFPQHRGFLPDINFHRLFNTGHSRDRSKVKTEKVMCLLNYFRQMSKSTNQEKLGHLIISYERRCLKEWEFPKWEESKKQMIKVVVEPRKKIEEADGMLQVDFANKIVGGGVLNDGAIMEEILFAICPELILARLFTEQLDENEVLVISGAHQFSKYKGYSSTFEFDVPHVITDLGQDNLGRLNTHVVAMDALHFQGNPTQQFQKRFIDRELRKSYVGFHQREPLPVATGNWGCGAFHGDIELKFFIQWIAASVAGCPSLHYHTIGDHRQFESINETVGLINSKNFKVGELYGHIVKFYDFKMDYTSIFQFIKDVCLGRFRWLEDSERSFERGAMHSN